MDLGKKVQICKVMQIVLSFLGTMAAAAFSPLFMFFQNAGEAHFSDVAPTMLMFMATGIVLYAIALLITRNPSKTGIISVVFLLVFLNYAHIESAIQLLLPSLRYWHILPVTIFLLLHIGWFIQKKLSVEFSEIIANVISAVLVVMIFLNGFLAIPSMATRIRAEKEAKHLAKETVASDKTMPNFYFILFDEFSTIPFMQKHFNYDNSKLVTKLENMGFAVSNTGHNDHYSTSTVTTNMFNLDYVVNFEDTEEDKFARRSGNIVFPMLKNAGYSIQCVSGGPFYGLENVTNTGTENATTMGGDTAHTLLMDMTVFYPIANPYYPERPRMILDSIDYMKKPDNFDASNKFVLFHVECPHPPFYFDADGNLLGHVTSDRNDKNNYLNQYIFSSNEMLKISDSITKNDPDAIIWLLSDHGERENDIPPEDMCNFFNAVYYQGKKLDIEGLSGVNTFRLILNELLGTNYEALPLPN